MHLTDENLNEYLDEATNDRAQMESHLSSCAECTARLSALQNLFAEIESLPEVESTRNFAAPFMRTRSQPSRVPAWLPLTMAVQLVVALTALVAAAPFVIQRIPDFQLPSLTDFAFQVQLQWGVSLDLLSRVQWPAIPSLSVELSSVYLLSALAAVSVVWLVGNGLLLRNQIR